jgi:hypothetical protein
LAMEQGSSLAEIKLEKLHILLRKDEVYLEDVPPVGA